MLLSQHDIPIEHQARRVVDKDFTTFTHILAADESNLSNLKRMAPRNSTAEIRLWGSYDDGKAISDPYYGGMVRGYPYSSFCPNGSCIIRSQKGFEACYQQCIRYSNSFLDEVLGQKQDEQGLMGAKGTMCDWVLQIEHKLQREIEESM